MTRAGWVVLTVGALFGCGSAEHPLDVRYADGAAVELDVESAVRAAEARWQAATGLEAWPTEVVAVMGEVPCANHPQAVGCTIGQKITLRLDVADQATLDRIALHEVGHLFQPDHDGCGDGIMAPGIACANTTAISAADLALACGDQPCRWMRAEE